MEQNILFSPLDRHFARFMTALAGRDIPALYGAAALLSRHVAEGHVCLDLKKWERRRLLTGIKGKETVDMPALNDWKAQLQDTPVVGRPGDFMPIVLDDGDRLYLYRYWEYEDILAGRIKKMVSAANGPPGWLPDRPVIERLFPAAPGDEPDWQRIAALVACLKPFVLISGPPGTGKTSTVARILALLMAQPDKARPRIALAAPTGKAAARLQAAIGSAREMIDCDASIKACMPDKASTVHRLLGSQGGAARFRHDRDNPLAADIVVVDEASMMDLPLLSKLVQALPETARLILLGDKDQLASVEAGAVLGDLCGASAANRFSREMLSKISPFTGDFLWSQVEIAPKPGIHDGIVQLRKNYRFAGDSDIGEVSAAVNRGEGARLIEELKGKRYRNVCWSPLTRRQDIDRMLKPAVLEGFGAYLNLVQSGRPWEDIFSAFEHFRILCAFRQGPFGVLAINRSIEQILAEAHLIHGGSLHYSGRPIMVSGNHASLKLYNGDTGLILPDPETVGHHVAAFPDGPGQFRRFSPGRLPAHETAYAATVHKSQGSEYDEVLLILSDTDAPLLTRELVYTGITRARKRVLIRSAEDVLKTSISRCIQRTSGLRDAIWQSPS